MTIPSWNAKGQYYETCSCDFFCPCLMDKMTPEPTKGTCTFAMTFQIEKGSYDSVSLDGLTFIVLGFTPEAMIKGNWSVGLVIDDHATPEQGDAIAAIASGAAGGPMAALAGLIGKFLGVESAPIKVSSDGTKWAVKAADKVDMAGHAHMGIDPNANEPMRLWNSGHPAANPVTLNKAIRSHVAALGMSWTDATGANSGLSAPFSWHSA